MKRVIGCVLAIALSGCVTITAVGDSNTAVQSGITKWCEAISGQTIQCTNRAVGGRSATGCTSSSEAEFVQALADVSTNIVMWLGTNDLGGWPSCAAITPADVVAALQAYETRAVAAGKTFWVATIPPEDDIIDQWAIDMNARYDAANALIRSTFAHVIEVHDTLMVDGVPNHALFLYDHVHLNQAGQNVIRDLMNATFS